MNTININGVEFNDFGANNYTNGMHLITCYPMPENMIQNVLDGKYPGVYLNPSARCSYEFYGLFGTDEQYADVKERQEEAQISHRLINAAGGFDAFSAMCRTDEEKTRELEATIRSQYKNWWEEA